MTASQAVERHDVTFLLGLLHLAGWRLEVRSGAKPSVRARRSEVELEAGGASFAEAVGIIFVQAMRSGSAARSD